ncbi:hypothetical protein [Polyangium sp. 15x6]|uniref:hypothetical protein n=1 Tax=Polyangium sp. 15x6 TaxID=3042687 RepID=UPI00249A66A5|nr:hypothetical protein [Polyangium sp. 15x6]MDI3291417.1 hypothetical protein [Polyangium sp. 15x6]
MTQRQSAPLGAASGSGTAQRAMLESEKGQNHKGKMLAWTKKAWLRVGRRKAFFNYSPATHAVFEADGKVYGLKGDLGGGEIDVDDNTLKAPYTWVTDYVDLLAEEMNLFWAQAQNEATKMTYTLVTHNCYSPVTAGLVSVLGQMVEKDPRRKLIEKMLEDLNQDNFGLGSYNASHSHEDLL